MKAILTARTAAHTIRKAELPGSGVARPALAKVREGFWRNAETEVHVFRVRDGYLPCTTNRFGTSVPISSSAAATMKQARGIAERTAVRVRESIAATHAEALRLDGTR